MKLYWNPDSPPCRLTWLLLVIQEVDFAPQRMEWSELKSGLLEFQGQSPAPVQTENGQIPTLALNDGQILSDSLQIAGWMFGKEWWGSQDFHLFRLAETHLAHLLHWQYWAAKVGTTVAGDPRTVDVIAGELVKILQMKEVILRHALAQETGKPRIAGPIALDVSASFLLSCMESCQQREKKSPLCRIEGLLTRIAGEALPLPQEIELKYQVAQSELVEIGAQFPVFSFRNKSKFRERDSE